MDSILISRDGQQFGPFTLEQLREHVKKGTVLPSDYAWKEGMANWITVAEMLAAAAPPPIAPAAAPAPAPAAAPLPAATPAFRENPAGSGAAASGRSTLDIGACVSAGISGLKKDPVLHIVCTLLVGVIGNVSMGLLTGPMMVGYMRMLKKIEQGQKAEIGDVFKGFDDFVPALVAMLVGGIVVGIGMILCIIPGLLIMALLPTAAYLVAFGEKDGINALKRAWVPVKENLLGSCLCMLALVIVGYLGLILCFVGVFLTLPIAMIGMYEMAKQLNGDAA